MSYPWLTVNEDGSYSVDIRDVSVIEADRRLVIMQELAAGRLVLPADPPVIPAARRLQSARVGVGGPGPPRSTREPGDSSYTLQRDPRVWRDSSLPMTHPRCGCERTCGDLPEAEDGQGVICKGLSLP